MRETAEALRLKVPPVLPGEGLLEEVVDVLFPVDEEECGLDGNGGAVRDLTNGAKACLAACKTRNFFKV
jgi:hypothetical protein